MATTDPEMPVEEPPPGMEEVADAVVALFSASQTSGDARQGYGDVTEMIVAAAAAADDPAEVFTAAEEALLWAYEGEQTAEAAARIDAALARTATSVEYVEPKQGGAVLGSARGSGVPTDAGDAATRDPALKVYFVNGVNNPLEFARGTTARLVQVLGHDVVHYYNPSSFNPRQYTEDWCARALATLIAERRQASELWKLQGDAAAREEVLRAAEEGRFSWLTDAIHPTALGIDRDTVHAIKGAGYTAAEYAASVACSGVDAIKETLEQDLSVRADRFVLEWLANTFEVAKNRVEVFTEAQAYDAELVEMVKRDITQGRRVVLIGHSHGTMIVRLALVEINRWYIDVVGGCPDGRTSKDVAPVAAIYVSPGFNVDADSQQYPVMVRGDFLGLTAVGHTPNIEPTGDQIDRGWIARHDLLSYLEDGTHTQAYIRWSLRQAAYRVTSVPDRTRACGGEAPPPLPEEFSPIEGAHWRLFETVVNPTNFEDPPDWVGLAVAPGHLSFTQVDDAEDPRFAAAYNIEYSLPPRQVELGSRNEIAVTVHGRVTRSEASRDTQAAAIRVQDRHWQSGGAVSVNQRCGHQDSEIVCDPPASRRGTLQFTAPERGDTFEFTVTLLNCTACGVLFRYEYVE